jgi:hypothetical protein
LTETGGVVVSDEVKIEIFAEFVKSETQKASADSQEVDVAAGATVLS